MKILETARTILRRFHLNDLDALCDMHMNPEAMKYLVGGARSSRSEVLKDLEAYLELDRKENLSKWALVEKNTNRFMGRAGLITIPETQEIDLGYALHPQFWGQGFATEVAQGLLQLADDRGLLAQTIALVLPENLASARVLQKIGMRHTGVGNYFGVSGFHIYRP